MRLKIKRKRNGETTVSLNVSMELIFPKELVEADPVDIGTLICSASANDMARAVPGIVAQLKRAKADL